MIAPSYSEAMLAERIYCLRSCSNSFDETAAQPKSTKSTRITRNSLRICQVPSMMPSFIGQTNCAQQQFIHCPVIESEVHTRKDDLTPQTSSLPPTYEEVIDDIHQCQNSRDRLKSYWQSLLNMIQSGFSQARISRSLTDKDFFQKLLTAQFARKPWNSMSDIQNNLITNV